jgi:hypothetical protein
MEVYMKDGLAGIPVAVHNKPESAGCNFAVFCDLGCYLMHSSDKLIVIVGDFKRGGYMFAGDDQDMNRGLGIYIFKSHNTVVLVYYGGRYFLF